MRLRSRWARVLLCAVCVGCVWLGLTTWLVRFPVVDPWPTEPADVLFVLGPHDRPRIDAALAMMDAGVATSLVVSTPVGVMPPEWLHDLGFCHSPQPHPVTCFAPEPSDTRGEARQAARMAAQHHWRTVIVVTTTPHVSRARWIFQRCGLADVRVVDYPLPMSVRHWAFHHVYQTAGAAKELFKGECRP